MTVLRWTLTEKGTATSWVMTLNPNTMASLPMSKNLNTVSGGPQDRARTFQLPGFGQEFSWGGVILSQVHYETLAIWAEKPGVIVVDDHLQRSFEIIISSFEVQPGPTRNDYKMDYTMTALFLRRVA